MVWDLETMEKNNAKASYDYVDRNRDIIDAAVGNVISLIQEQVFLAVKTINLETERSLNTIRSEVDEQLGITVVETKGMKE